MFNYDDEIEYIDGTWDENLNNAINWCNENSTKLIELVDKRTKKDDKLYRYFIIKQIEVPEEPEEPEIPEEDEEIIDPIQQQINILLNNLAEWDYKTSKYVDGNYTEEEWQEIVNQRNTWRREINELEQLLLEKGENDGKFRKIYNRY